MFIMSVEVLNYENFTTDPFKNLNYDDDTKGALKVLDWGYGTYGDSIIYSCSFGAESMVLIDLISRVRPDAKIVFLDTGLHFEETYDLIDRVKQRYPSLRIELKKPDLTVDEQAERHGQYLWQRDPGHCCHIRKIKPLEDVLGGAAAWISGLRREQSASRRNTDFVNRDERFESIKVCPLIHWSHEDIWGHIAKNDLPYNALHDQNYPSIGCIPCTSQVFDSEDSRAGRWSGFDKTECGLHTSDDNSK